MIYRHTPEMGEISGFGGTYEQTCQDMLENGMKWLVANPDSDVKAQEYPNIFGLASVSGEDGDSLENAILDGITNATGVMHHAVLNRLVWIKNNGWDKYVEELVSYRKSKQD